jgi:DNA-binding response OmpR family regulator
LVFCAVSRSLNGKVVLIVQRSWVLASGLATALEAKGARPVLAKEGASALADIPNLCVAVLHSETSELCKLLEARDIPFLFYTACEEIEGEFATAPIVHKPASAQDVVARVEQLLR